MPIILLWNAAAAPYVAQVNRWLDEMARSNLLLEKWLEKRLREAERLDRISSAFKVFRFYNTALTARIADAQFGALLTQPIGGVGSHIERALDQWDLPRDVRVQARSANLPREALRVLEEITTAVLSSLRRFETPTPGMFDPRRRTASDLIGLAALTFRAVGANRQGLFAAAARLKRGLEQPARAGPGQAAAPGGAESGAGDAARALPLAMRLDGFGRQVDEITRYVVSALLVIPAIAGLLRRIGGDALIAVRYRLLAAFERIESLAYRFRRRLFITLRDGMRAFAEATLQFLARISGLAVGYVRAFTGIAVDYLRGTLEGVGAFADQFQTFWRAVTDLIDRVVSFGEALVSIDIGEVIHLSLVAVQETISYLGSVAHGLFDQPEDYDAPAQFPVTIGEVVLNEGAGVRANNELRKALLRLSAAIGEGNLIGLVRWLSSSADQAIGTRVRGLVQLSRALALPRRPLTGQPVLTVDTSGAPNLVADVVTPLRNGLTRAVANLGTAADRTVGDIFGAARTALTETTRSFREASAAAALTSPLAAVRRLTGETDELLDTLLADQERGWRRTGFEPVARTFGEWLTRGGLQGGFDTIGRVAGGYVRFVLHEWLVHLAENRDTPVEVTPTSPRRLLERAELGRVQVRELRIVARGNPLGRPLADRVAVEFRSAVQGAYRTGSERLAQYAAAAQ